MAQTRGEAGLPGARHGPALIALADATSQEELGSDCGPAKSTHALKVLNCPPSSLRFVLLWVTVYNSESTVK